MERSNDKDNDFFYAGEFKKGLRESAFRGGALMMGSEIVCSLSRIVSVIILARLLLPEDFGLVAMVTALTVFAERFKDMGLGDATVQSAEINHGQTSNLFWINLTICTAIAVFLAALSKPIAWFYNEPRLTAITLVIASTFVFSGLIIQHEAVLWRKLNFRALALVKVSAIMLSILTAIILACYGFGYWALVAREFSRAVFFFLGMSIACPWRPGLPQRGIDISRFLNFGKNVTGSNAIHFFSRGIDKILIGKLQGPYWTGLYANAYQLMVVPVNQFLYSAWSVGFPALSALQKEPTRFRERYENIVRFMAFFSMPIVLFIALFGDVIVKLLLGPRWMNMVPIARVLAIGILADPVAGMTSGAMMAYGKTKERLRLTVTASSTFIVCVAIGSLWGAMGVAVGYSIASYIILVASLVYGARHTPIRTESLLRKLAPTCLSSLFTFLIFSYLRNITGWYFRPARLILFAIAGLLTYLGLQSIFPGSRRVISDIWSNFTGFIPWIKRRISK